MLPLREQATAYDSHHYVVFALTTRRTIITGTTNKGIYFGRTVHRLLCQRAPKAVVALHQSKTLGPSHHFVFNRVAQLLCSSFLLVAHFTGNPHFTPFHWLDTHTRKHFLPMLLIC